MANYGLLRMAKHIHFSIDKNWRNEIEDIIRGASGGFLFGIPLLYTMEAWWIGSYTEPPLMLGVLAITFVIVFFLNRTDGFRQTRPDSRIQALMDSVDAIAIGAVCAAIILVLLREITIETPLDEALGKIIIESVPFAIGVGLAGSALVGERNRARADESDKSNESNESNQANGQDGQNAPDRLQHSSLSKSPIKKQLKDKYNATLADIGATLVGSIIVAFNIAPTDEVPMLAAAASPPWLLAIIVASLVISYCIVFVAGFTTQQKRRQHPGAFQRPITETVFSYLISLLAAMFMLWFFHRLSFSDPWTLWLEHVLILGLPATVGGAAGRLAV
jgi:putative integral membrane protein (TIGR02587 family)